MIVSNGSDSAEIMVVGDYASKDDAIHGSALSGSAERVLGNFFREAGYNISRCYRTLLFKEMPAYDGKSPKQKFLALQKIQQNAVLQGINYENILKDEIVAVRPNIIVPLGDLSLKYLSGYAPISNYRGSVLPLNPYLQSLIPDKTVRVIGTLSPRAVNESFTSRVFVQLDFNKIVKLKEQIGPIEVPGQIWVCRRIEAFRNFLERHQDFFTRDPKDQFITCDIETYLGFITAISFCFDGKEAFSVPINADKTDPANALLLYIEIAKILNDVRIPKVNQNVKFDWTTTERFGLPWNNVSGDTVLGFHLLYPELPKNLGFQASIYTELPYFKDESNKKEIAFNPKLYNRDTLYLYNAKDALATWQIHRKQIDEMEEQGVLELYRNRIVPLIQIYKEIDQTGLLVDQAKKKFLLGKYRSLLSITATRLINRLSPVMDVPDIDHMLEIIRSHVKLGYLIYDVLKFPPRYKTTEGGKKTQKTDKDTLDDLMILYGNTNKLEAVGRSILGLILSIKKLIKVIEYIKTPLHPDGTLKASYNLAGTENARSSSSKTFDQIIEFDAKGKLVWPLKKLGRSLQTITKHGFEIEGEVYDAAEDQRFGADLRSMFIPRKGNCYVEGDSSQAEARVVAVLAEDYELLKAFDEKPKIHAKTAGLIFSIDPWSITKDFPIIPDIGMTYYDLGKRATHAANLGIGEFRLAQMTHLEIQQCREILLTVHNARPKIKNIFHNDVYEFVKRNGYLRSPWGRIRQFFERMGPSIAKEIYACLPQSTVSDNTKFAFIPTRCRAPWATLVYEGHDAGMAEVPIARKEEYGAIFKEEMERPIDFSQCSLFRDIQLSIPCELSWGENWGEMEDLKL